MGPITSVFRLEAIALVLQEEYIAIEVFSGVIALLFSVVSAVVLLEQFFRPIGSTALHWLPWEGKFALFQFVPRQCGGIVI